MHFEDNLQIFSFYLHKYWYDMESHRIYSVELFQKNSAFLTCLELVVCEL